MTSDNKIAIDVSKIKRILREQDKTPKALIIDARISESTWHRIKRSNEASFHVAITFAYMLGLRIEDIMMVRENDA